MKPPRTRTLEKKSFRCFDFTSKKKGKEFLKSSIVLIGYLRWVRSSLFNRLTMPVAVRQVLPVRVDREDMRHT